jgi:hypothetical protein
VGTFVARLQLEVDKIAGHRVDGWWIENELGWILIRIIRSQASIQTHSVVSSNFDGEVGRRDGAGRKNGSSSSKRETHVDLFFKFKKRDLDQSKIARTKRK